MSPHYANGRFLCGEIKRIVTACFNLTFLKPHEFMTENISVLVVDDDKQIRTMLRRYLEEERFRVLEAADGVQMRQALSSCTVDLVLMDLTLPGEDGLALARYIRQSSNIPIIMLTGKSDVIDRVAGLEAGADDYIAKPFHLREVLARIRTVMRRSMLPPPTEQTSQASQSLTFDRWRLDLRRRSLVDKSGEPVALTASEFELLKVLAQHCQRVLSRETLMDMTKGQEWSPYDRAIDTQIGRLRKKLERQPNAPELIKTVRGAGYVLAAVVTSE